MAHPDFGQQPRAKLDKVTLSFDDGTIATLTGDQAHDWLIAVNRAVLIDQTRRHDFRLSSHDGFPWKVGTKWVTALKKQFSLDRLPG